ncbi:MAG: transposase family protein [candidate division WOR-3 bacterium]
MPDLKNLLFKTAHRFLGGVNAYLNSLKDPRQAGKIDYPLRFLIWTGILLFTFKLASRRRIRYKFNTAQFLQNLNCLSQSEQHRVPHDKTLADLLEQLDPKHLVGLRRFVVRQLIRRKTLDKWRLLNRYHLVAIDATRLFSFKERHCEHCLTETHSASHGKKTTYYHMVLEAKIVTASGLSLSIDSEFVENPGPEPDKQDCELAAFYRIVERIHREYPIKGLCLVVDSLYAGKRFFEICERFGWKYIVVFKEGKMPAVFQEYETLKKLSQYNQHTHRLDEEGATQSYRWVNMIDYEGHKLNALDCTETTADGTRRFAWLTNLWVCKGNCVEIGNHGGRQRWKIENQGFKAQKKEGYNLEHAYSEHSIAMKNFYVLLQVGHMLSQLMEHNRTLRPLILKLYGSYRDFTEELREEFRRAWTTAKEYASLIASAFQIRLDSSREAGQAQV